MVLASAESQDDGETAQQALAQLCQTYWRPVFSFICRRGHSVPDAQDLTQDFFVMVLKGHLLQRADPDRGRFRSLVLKAVQDFLVNASEKQQATKRGGNAQFVSWDEWITEMPSHLAISAQEASTWSPERIFDVRWAATAAEHALRQLGEECENRGRRRVFDVLSDYLAAERQDISYEKLSRTLGVPEVSVKRLIHEMRVRFRDLLRAEVAETVEKPQDVDGELRYLCAALAAG
jgi:RNA polymerase sigma-70 factor (ECF subfamily)